MIMTLAETSPSQVRGALGHRSRQKMIMTLAETYPSQVRGALGQRSRQKMMIYAETSLSPVCGVIGDFVSIGDFVWIGDFVS